MGTLERIRKTSPFIIGAFAVILIAFFVISDIDPNSLMQNRMRVEEIAEVNGEKISYKEFETKARVFEEQQRAANLNNPEAPEIDGTAIRMQMFDAFVDKAIMSQEAEKAGAQVTNGAVLDIMLENPPKEVQRMFSDSTGRFAREAYVQYMTRPEEVFKNLPAGERQEQLARFRETMIQIQDEIKDQLLFNNMQSLVAASATVISPLYAQELITSEANTANVDYLAFDITSIKDDEVKVSDNEIKDYYEKHKEYYTQVEQRQIKYLFFPIVASKADSAEADKKIKRIYESLSIAKENGTLDSVYKERLHENSLSTTVDFTPISNLNPRLAAILAETTPADFVGPVPMEDGFHFIKLIDKRTNTNEEVQASHILIKFGEDKEAAKTKINEILAEAKTGDFAELAKKHSQDGSAPNGGDLGFFKKGQMVKEFEEAAFAAKVGEVVGPVETMFGYHLIKVTEKKNDPQEEISYSDLVVKPIISNMARNQVKRRANHVSTLINEKGMDIDAAAKEVLDSPMPAMETPFYDKQRVFPGFETPFACLHSFDVEKGKAFGPWEDKNLGLVVAQVSGVRKAGIASLEDKKEEIKNILIRNKKLEILKKKAEEAYKNITASGLTMESMKADSTRGVRTVDVKNNGSVPMLGLDYGFTQNVFMKETGKMLAPFRGERAYYIVQINSRQMMDKPAFKDITAMSLMPFQQQAMGNAFNLWYMKVREDAKIVDNRLKVWGPGF